MPSSEPLLKRPKDFCEFDIVEPVDSFLDLPSLLKLSNIIGIRFLQKDIDIVFCINAVHVQPDGLHFSIKYEDIRYDTECFPAYSHLNYCAQQGTRCHYSGRVEADARK